MCCPDHAIGKTGNCLALICFILNIFLPGIGTMINSFFAKRCCEGFAYGILQLLTTALIVGWVWSIVYGWKIVQKSRHPDVIVVHH